MSQADIALVRQAWDAFARGDVDGVLEAFDPQACWHAAGNPDSHGACHNRQDVEEFVRALLADGVTADLLEIHEVGGRIVARLQTRHPGEPGD